MKIYTGVNQESGWLGECYTDITNIEDLHLLGVDINSVYYISFFLYDKTTYHNLSPSKILLWQSFSSLQ